MMNSCNHFENMLDAYLEGSLSDKEYLFMKEHDISCKHCHEELLFRQSVYHSLHTLPQLPVSPDFTVRLNARLNAVDAEKVQAVQKTPAITNRFRFVYHWKKYSAVAACLLLAVLVRIDIANIITKTNSTPNITDDYTVSDSILPNDADKSYHPSGELVDSQETTEPNRADMGVENMAVPSSAPTTATDGKTSAQSSKKPASNKNKTVTPIPSASANTTAASLVSPRPAVQSTAPTAKPQRQNTTLSSSGTAAAGTTSAPPAVSKQPEQIPLDKQIATAAIDPSTQTSDLPSSQFSIPVNGGDEISVHANTNADHMKHNMGRTVSKSGEFTLVDEAEGHTVAGVNISSAMNSFVIVDAQNETQVKEILSRHLAAADNSAKADYFLTPTGYQSFIDDLKENNIDFKCTFDFPGNSPVLVKLIIT